MGGLRTGSAGLLAAAALALCGCESKPKIGTVSGKVTLDGKPVPGAVVTFLAADDRVATALADGEGSYRSDTVPAGSVRVGVVVPPEDAVAANEAIKRSGLNPDPRAKAQPAPAPKPKGAKVPARYADPLTSDLTYTVAEGPNAIDIPLVGK